MIKKPTKNKPKEKPSQKSRPAAPELSDDELKSVSGGVISDPSVCAF